MMKRLLFILLLCAVPCWAYVPNQKPMLGEQIDWSNPLAKSLVGYWLMNEGAGTQVNDLSGNGHTGAISGATWQAELRGSSLSFAGANSGDGVAVSAVVAVPLTLTAWVYPIAYDGLYNYFLAGPTISDAFRVNSSGQALVLRIGSTSYTASTGAVSTGAWHHVAVTVNGGGAVTYYIDGLPRGGATGASGTFTLNWIGRRDTIQSDHYEWHGQIDSSAVYNRALTATEIASLYADPYQLFRRGPQPEYYVAGGEPPAPSGAQVIFVSGIPAIAILGMVGACVWSRRKAA